MPPLRCLKSTVCHAPPRAVGFTHAEAVIPVDGRRDGASATVTQSSEPSNVSAPPKRPAAVRAAPEIVPALPAGEASATVAPEASSKPHAPTRPAGVGQAGASVTVKVTSTVSVSPAPL